MSINVPEKLSKQEYNDLLNDLKKYDLTKYTDLIKENYKKPKGETEYSLKDGIAEPIRINLDYVLKRMSDKQAFDNLQEIARYLRMLLEDKKYVLLFAYNGTGKTRLSAEFKTLGQTLNEETGEKTADTLYYNAFTEDLFYWDNDLENDTERFLKLNSDSRFFSGLSPFRCDPDGILPVLHELDIGIKFCIIIIQQVFDVFLHTEYTLSHFDIHNIKDQLSFRHTGVIIAEI